MSVRRKNAERGGGGGGGGEVANVIPDFDMWNVKTSFLLIFW